MTKHDFELKKRGKIWEEPGASPADVEAGINKEDVSFILERRAQEEGGNPSKIGTFSLALVMCMCFFGSFLAPV